MIPSLFYSYAQKELEKTRKRLQFNSIAGASPERLQMIKEREEYLMNILKQYNAERMERN